MNKWDRAPRQSLRHGRQAHRQPRWPLGGFVPRENILGPPSSLYWSFKTPADQMYKTTIGDRIAFTSHELIHIFDETRWNPTMKIVR